MKKRVSMIFLLIACMAFLPIVNYFKNLKVAEPEATLLKSFNNTGAKAVSGELYFWSKLEKKADDLQDYKALAEAIAKEMGALEGKNFKSMDITNDSIKLAEVKAITSNNETIEASIREETGQDGREERMVYVDVVLGQQIDRMETMRQKTIQILKKYDLEPTINSCITGYFTGKLGNEKLNDICKTAFKEAEARKVEGIADGELVSVSAYSPIIDDYIRVNGKKVNFNMAIRYNSYEDRTYIWLATPVITTEY